jgi:comEA protein
MTTQKSKVTALGLAAAILVFSLASAYAQSAAPKGKVNINTATIAELETLPRVGPKVAQRIVDFRTKNGNFKRIEEIMKVQGIGEKVYEDIKDLITVGGENSVK